jgi:hypothetical protein
MFGEKLSLDLRDRCIGSLETLLKKSTMPRRWMNTPCGYARLKLCL